jgi:hypothetical protein
MVPTLPLPKLGLFLGLGVFAAREIPQAAFIDRRGRWCNSGALRSE